MASLKQLSIQGVRAFNQQTQSTINFSDRITVILGSNGCGKTTILECLRFAITGCMPPHSKNGRSFVNDPTLRGKSKTTAVVELLLCLQPSNIPAKIYRYVITRSLVLQVKGNKQKMGKINHQLVTQKNGVNSILAQTPTDVNLMVPRILEVNKAVIENVMFCHQEHSTWPFSDNATLKKIFDDLFDTKKNVKMVENLRKSSHQLKINLAKAKYQVEVSLGDLELKKKVLFGYSDKTKELKKIKDSISLLNVKIEALNDKWSNVPDTENKEKLFGDLGILNFQYKNQLSKKQEKLSEKRELQKQIDKVSNSELTNLMIRRILRLEGEISQKQGDDEFLNYFEKTTESQNEDYRHEEIKQKVKDVSLIRTKWYSEESKSNKKKKT
jgi:DNA repair protein RAD50